MPSALDGLVPLSCWPFADRRWLELASRLELGRYTGGAPRSLVLEAGAGARRAAHPALLCREPARWPALNPRALLFEHWRALPGAPAPPLAAAAATLLDRALRAAGARLERALLLVTPLAYEACPWFAPGADAADRAAAYDGLLDAAQALAREERAVLVTLSPDETASQPSGLDARLARRGFGRFLVVEEHRLSLGEGDFERAYLARFPGRQRARIRRERRVRDHALEAVPLGALDPFDLARLVELYRATCAVYGDAWMDLDAPLLQALGAALPEVAWVTLARDRAGRIASYCLDLVRGDRWFAWHAGQDRQEGAGRGLYFEVVLHQGIELALRLGAREGSWSFLQGALKRRRGAHAVARHAWIWHHSPLVRAGLRPWLARFSRAAGDFYRRDAWPEEAPCSSSPSRPRARSRPA